MKRNGLIAVCGIAVVVFAVGLGFWLPYQQASTNPPIKANAISSSSSPFTSSVQNTTLGVYFFTSTYNEVTNGTFTVTYTSTSTQSTTINGSVCLLVTESGTGYIGAFQSGMYIIPNSSYIYQEPLVECGTTQTVGTYTATSYVMETYSNATSGTWTIHVFPTLTTTTTETVAVYTTSITTTDTYEPR
jgi:hypothetical protein